jgi:hypothetical protein
MVSTKVALNTFAYGSFRKYYAASIHENGQLVMKWDDLNAMRPPMEVAAANRRNQILGQCWQLKNDMDSYSERSLPYRSLRPLLSAKHMGTVRTRREPCQGRRISN